MKKISFFLMAMLVSLASFAQTIVPTNEELWEAFKPYYNEFYGDARSDQPITAVATFMTKGEKILTDATSEYKWLGDYLLKVTNEQIADGTLKTYTGITTEVKWRFATQAFFNCSAAKDADYSGNADFTEAGKPENWGPYYLAAQQKPEEPVMETVYFVNAQGWTGTINAYAWEPVQNASWPGVAATKEAEQIAGYDVYSYTVEAGTYANVIFNNGSGQQTADLVWTAGKYYVKDGWYTKEEAEAKLAAPVEYESVYFVNNLGWSKVNIYTWTPEVGSWPGVAMTKEAEQLAGYDVYSYTVEKGTTFGGMLFNNTSGTQTADLKWTAGKYYVNKTWMTKEEAEAALAGPVTPPVITYVLMGVKGDWTTGIAMTQNADNANEYVLLQQEILEGDAVKVVTLTDGTATAWCGNVDEYSVAHSADDMGNIVLAPGKYDFYYKVAEDLIYIGGEAYPTEPVYEVMELTMTNLSVDTYGEATGLWASDTDNGIEVMLFLDAEGNLMAESSIMVSWMDYAVTGTVTKAYNEELATDVYTAELYTTVAETNYKLIITMYAVPVEVVEVVVENATITVEELPDGVGGTYESINVSAQWGESTLLIEGIEKNFEGFVMITEKFMVDGEEDWYIWMGQNATVTTVDNVLTVTGEFKNNYTHDVYNVTISGKLPVVEPTTITYELNGGEIPAVVVPTNAELWGTDTADVNGFMHYYNHYYGLKRATQTIENVASFAYAQMQQIMTDEASAYKWLGDYVQSVATAAGKPLSTDMAAANESGWRWSVWAFFNACAGKNGSVGIDFTEAGKPENWGPAYQAANALVLPTEPVAEDYKLPTPTKEGYTFVGWYDNAEGEGTAMTVLPAGWAGTLYAIWKANGPTTDLDNIAVEGKAVKAIINGQLIIIKNGVQYNVQGAILK